MNIEYQDMDPDEYYVRGVLESYSSNSFISIPILNDFMTALADPNTHIIGVYGSNGDIQHNFIPKPCRKIHRYNVFGVILIAYVKKIQDEIACQLGLIFYKKSEGERAHELLDRIKNEQKILIMLFDHHKDLDLGKIGIPSGEHHKGCNILLTSSVEILFSNQIHTHNHFVI